MNRQRPFSALDASPCISTNAEDDNIIETLPGIYTSITSTCGSTSTSREQSRVVFVMAVEVVVAAVVIAAAVVVVLI